MAGQPEDHTDLATTRAASIVEYLDAEGVDHTLIEHDPTMSAAQEARATGEPAHKVAKTIVLEDRGYLLAVVPGDERLDLHKLRELLGATKSLRLATEAEMADLFPSFEVGAAPPFGPGFPKLEVVDGRSRGEVGRRQGRTGAEHLPRARAPRPRRADRRRPDRGWVLCARPLGPGSHRQRRRGTHARLAVRGSHRPARVSRPVRPGHRDDRGGLRRLGGERSSADGGEPPCARHRREGEAGRRCRAAFARHWEGRQRHWHALKEAIEEDVRDTLTQGCSAVPEGIDAEPILASGEPAAALSEAAEEPGTVLILGSRGYGPVRRVLLGSVSRVLARAAASPVIIHARGTHEPARQAPPTQVETAS